MSKQITVTKHIYITKYGVEDFHNVHAELNPCDIHVMHKDDEGNDYFLYLCPVELTVDVPSEDQARLLELAGMEKEYNAFKAKTLEKLQAMESQIAEMRALTYQEDVA
jgi:hypothetical protein